MMSQLTSLLVVKSEQASLYYKKKGPIMTNEEQQIIEAIWGDQDPNMSERDIKALTLGIKIMAEIMEGKYEDGKIVAFEAPTNLH